MKEFPMIACASVGAGITFSLLSAALASTGSAIPFPAYLGLGVASVLVFLFILSWKIEEDRADLVVTESVSVSREDLDLLRIALLARKDCPKMTWEELEDIDHLLLTVAVLRAAYLTAPQPWVVFQITRCDARLILRALAVLAVVDETTAARVDALAARVYPETPVFLLA
jgi:hypothetical protein